MNGLQMVLKAFGIDIDPAELMRTAEQAQKLVSEFQASLVRIEAQQARIIALLEEQHVNPHVNGIDGHSDRARLSDASATNNG